MCKKDFQSIRQVMKPKVPLKQLKFDSHDLNKAIKEVIERKMKERIEAGLKKAIEDKNAGN